MKTTSSFCALLMIASAAGLAVSTGCDRKKPAEVIPPSGPIAPGPTAPGPIAPASLATPETRAMAGQYGIDQPDKSAPGQRMIHEELTLRPDGTARFESKSVDTHASSPPRDDAVSVGTFTVAPGNVIVVLQTRNGKPIGDKDSGRTMTISNTAPHLLNTESGNLYSYKPLPGQSD
jgi:hypothetical protein